MCKSKSIYTLQPPGLHSETEKQDDVHLFFLCSEASVAEQRFHLPSAPNEDFLFTLTTNQ